MFILRTFSILLFAVLCCFLTIGSAAQPADDAVYAPNIKTILFHKSGFELSPPLMMLNGPDKLQLSFDDLDNDLKPYRYTIVHCTSGWNVTPGLTESDYIAGFPEMTIDQFGYSANTTVPYTHYTLNFPEGNLKPKISGNYLLKVYVEDLSRVAFTRRFMVVEASPVTVTGEVHQATKPTDKYTKQEVDFSVRPNGMRIGDPVRELRVVITQNGRQDNTIGNLKPQFLRGDEYDYNYDEENCFNGGNEYRNLDLKSLRYQSERISTIVYDNQGYHVILLNDAWRTLKNHISDKDLNGREMIKNDDNSQNSDLDADYALVSFTLPSATPVSTGQIYLLGALTDWQLNEGSRMIYNPEKKAYEKYLLLKQGYYNYIYVLKDLKTSKADEAFVEGSHWETENEYTISVYYHEAGSLYDRLIALQNISTVK